MQHAAGERKLGHLLALGTIIVWGLTFISSSVVLKTLTPTELLITRMVIGIAALTALNPRRLKLKERRHELYFIGAGFFAVTLYFLLENTALTYTSSSNCAVIVSTAPFFIGIFASVFLKRRSLRLRSSWGLRWRLPGWAWCRSRGISCN